MDFKFMANSIIGSILLLRPETEDLRLPDIFINFIQSVSKHFSFVVSIIIPPISFSNDKIKMKRSTQGYINFPCVFVSTIHRRVRLSNISLAVGKGFIFFIFGGAELLHSIFVFLSCTKKNKKSGRREKQKKKRRKEGI